MAIATPTLYLDTETLQTGDTAPFITGLDNFTKALKYYKDPEKRNMILNQLFQEGQMAD